MVYISEIVVPHRGGLDPIGLSSHEQKYIFIESTEYQAVAGRNQTKESYILLILWRIMQCGEEFCTQENCRDGHDNKGY